jgi:glyoxylase-like metal-dependent hydrolase (beta-lactamase superfamily II)
LRQATDDSKAWLRQDWFEIEELSPGVFAISEPFHHEFVRSHLVLGTERAVLIDTGMGVGDIRVVVEELTPLLVDVINSHAHWDHIGANNRFDRIAIHHAEANELPLGYPNERYRAKFDPSLLTGSLPKGFDLATAAIAPSRADQLLSGGETFDLGGRRLDVIHAPGHSPGGIVLLDAANRLLFSTDVVYAGPLYAYGVDANFDDYRRTLARLASLAGSVDEVFPSHNAARMEPAALIAMRDALESIAAGRPPDDVRAENVRHRFDGFSVLMPPAERP